MMAWIAVAFLILGFVLLVRAFGLLARAHEAAAIARRSLAVVRDPHLDDAAKEAALQRNAVRLLRLFLILSAGGAAAALLPFGVVWLCDWANLVPVEAVLARACSPTALLIGGGLSLLAMGVPLRRSSPNPDYSFTDRLSHRIAFRTVSAQIAMADLENTLFARPLARCRADRPVFITALPRAGTTLLLECCSRVPDLAAHCYRDMPYALIPCLWHRFSSPFQRSVEKKPRSHGDGILIDLNSPEALEEMIWMAFWRRPYGDDRIAPWPDRDHPEFEAFFRAHMRKIVWLRRGHAEPEARYVSKNNLNIARIRWLCRRFPDATLIVPFRSPAQHASSLLKQHRRFLRIHEENPFACEYMRALGHFDFGRNLRPINFDQWLDRRTSRDAMELSFWLEYWIAGYGDLLRAAADFPQVHFLHYEAFCEAPEAGLRALGALIGTRHSPALLSHAPTIRKGSPHDTAADAIPPDLLRQATALYDRLTQRACTH